MPATVIHRQPTQPNQASTPSVATAQALQQQQQQQQQAQQQAQQQQINPVQTQAGSLYQDQHSLAKAQAYQQLQQQQMGHHLSGAALSPNMNGGMVHRGIGGFQQVQQVQKMNNY